jgi:hypothetical protein
VPDLPTGTVTFIFTVLENSTRPWEDQLDAMRSTLVSHDKPCPVRGWNPTERPGVHRASIARAPMFGGVHRCSAGDRIGV